MMTIRIVILIFMIGFPLFVIIGYQSIQLQEVDDEVVKRQIFKLQQQLKHQYQQKYQQIVQKYIGENPKRQRRRQFIDNLINKTLNNAHLMTQTIYKKKLIINILVTRQFLQQKQTILSTISHILQWLNQQYNLNWKYKIWNDSKDQSINIQQNIIILFRQLKYEYIQQNIANKIKSGEYRNTHYLQQIAQQLRSLPILAHCKYTSLECQQISLMVIHRHGKDLQQRQTYWEVDKEIYFLDSAQQKMMFNVLISALSLDSLQEFYENNEEYRDLLKDIIKLKEMANELKIIDYLAFILKQNAFDFDILLKKWHEQPYLAIKYLKNGQYLSPYYHTHKELQSIIQILNIISSSNRTIFNKITMNPLTNDKIGLIDIFPNDFKLGVYLPLFVIFTFPVFTKVQEFVQFLIKNIIKKKKNK